MMVNSSIIIFYAQSENNLVKLLRRECHEFNDTVMIESPFKETTRDGTDILSFVRLAMTTKAFVIAPGKDYERPSSGNSNLRDESSKEILMLYPWHSVQLYVFKKTKRKCIKALYFDKSARYFQLQEIPKMKIHWFLWCRYIIELHNSTIRWPFAHTTNLNNQNNKWKRHCIEMRVLKHKRKVYGRPQWTDKYLYLGSIREAEDQVRPRPIPGLGKTEDIRLLYLKPRYFGCWEQSEHWVQCGDSLPEFTQEHDD